MARSDGLLRLSGSLKFGHATASVPVGRISAAGRQNALDAALKEHGVLRGAIYAAATCRPRRIAGRPPRRSNKDESLHVLKRDLLYDHCVSATENHGVVVRAVAQVGW